METYIKQNLKVAYNDLVVAAYCVSVFLVPCTASSRKHVSGEAVLENNSGQCRSLQPI